MSDPACKYWRWISSTTSGLVLTRCSLQPSREGPPQSWAHRCFCCNMVPMAPSMTRMRSFNSSLRACDCSVKFLIATGILPAVSFECQFCEGFGYNPAVEQTAETLRKSQSRIEDRGSKNPGSKTAIDPRFSILNPRLCGLFFGLPVRGSIGV